MPQRYVRNPTQSFMDTTPQNTTSTVPATDATPVVGGTATAAPLALPAHVPFYKNTHTIIALIIALGIIGGAGYYAYTAYYSDAVVAVVNGKKIYQKEYTESINVIKENAAAQGIDMADEAALTEIQKQALEVLVNNALLLTASEKAGFAATKEEIQAKYDELAAQFQNAEELKTRMAEVGLTEEKLRSNIEERILADKYIESKTDIETLSVTDAEVTAFIKSLNAGEGELPPLDQIRPQIEEEIIRQKQQKIVTDLLEELRTDAKIETTI